MCVCGCSDQVKPSRKDPRQEPIRRQSPSRRRAVNQPDPADPLWVTRGRHTLTFTFNHRSLLCGNLLQASSPFSCYSSGSSFLSLPPSLCPFILQSYKKAIDEVSGTRVPPHPPLFYPGFSLPRSSEPHLIFPPSHGGVSQEEDVFLSFSSLL